MKKEVRIMKLFDLATWKNGLAYKNIVFSDNGKPIIKIAELKNGITDQTKFTDQEFDNNVSLKKGDLLFSWSGTPETSIDAFWYDLPDGWLNQHIFKVIPNERIVDKTYFYYILKHNKPSFKAIASNKQTTGLGHITVKDLKEFKVQLPSLNDQKKVTDVLGTLDDKIELNEKINQNLEAQAQAIFKSWFVDFEPFKNGKFIDSELGKIPEGWEVKTLANIISLKKGKKPKRLSGVQYNTYMPYLTIDALSGGNPFFCEREKMLLASEKDILLVMDGASSGTIYYGLNGVVASTIIKLDFFDLKFQEIIFAFLVYNQSDLRLHTTGSAIPHLDKEHLLSYKIALPTDKKALEYITLLLLKLREKIICNKAESRRLAQLRDALLPKLMSGEIDVSELAV